MNLLHCDLHQKYPIPGVLVNMLKYLELTRTAKTLLLCLVFNSLETGSTIVKYSDTLFINYTGRSKGSLYPGCGELAGVGIIRMFPGVNNQRFIELNVDMYTWDNGKYTDIIGRRIYE